MPVHVVTHEVKLEAKLEGFGLGGRHLGDNLVYLVLELLLENVVVGVLAAVLNDEH